MKPWTAFATGLLMLAAVSCNRQSGKGKDACVEKPCESACTKEYRPVCGCNQKTYGNACMAECHGITDYTQGECPDKK